MNIPLPNETVQIAGTHEVNGLVIASTFYPGVSVDGLDRYTLVVLKPEPPYYVVVQVRDTGDELVNEWAVGHVNLVDAINGTGDGEEDYENGYIHMGGDR